MAKKRTYSNLGLTVQIQREGRYFIVYSTALDFSSCGKTIEEAKKMFRKGIQVFLTELEKMGTLEEVLLECGWRKVKSPKPHYVPPKVVARPEVQIKIPCPA